MGGSLSFINLDESALIISIIYSLSG